MKAAIESIPFTRKDYELLKRAYLFVSAFDDLCDRNDFDITSAALESLLRPMREQFSDLYWDMAERFDKAGFEE